jgi:uncharacterized protein involved in response to NO
MTPVPRLKSYRGPPILSYGFRPFFLLGALYAAGAVGVWLAGYFGEIAFSSLFAPPAWHAHEMLFGFVAAVIAGFLLTAVPNWTGRLPLQGAPLIALLAFWFLGRVAVAFGATLGWLPAMALDCAFLTYLTAAIGWEIVAGAKWRNLKVLAILGLLLASNAGFHIEAHLTGGAVYAERASIALVLMLVMLVGGRIVPSFTHNWLLKTNPGRKPALSVGARDQAIMASTIVALTMWVLYPTAHLTGALLAIVAVAQAFRMSRWEGWRSWREPIVMVLHLAYAFIPLGFALSAAGVFFADVVPPGAGLHAWTAGTMGSMILAVMTRASLGHTGRALQADRRTTLIYAAVAAGAILRIVAALLPQHAAVLLLASGCIWSAAFVGFAVTYGPYLLAPRL